MCLIVVIIDFIRYRGIKVIMVI